MSSFVMGIDLGTSAVKVLLVDREGNVKGTASESYPLHSPKSGYSEQHPEDWVQGTVRAVRQLIKQTGIPSSSVDGISFSGQMHGLVLLDNQLKVIRPAILWNDTRTTAQCQYIDEILGERLLQITGNSALEGFTLPKLLWVKKYEPHHYERAHVFVLPKDYVRFRLTGEIHMDYSDAAGTLMLDVAHHRWSTVICDSFDLSPSLCPPLIDSHDCVGALLPKMAEAIGLDHRTPVFAGGADNACGAVGSGILEQGQSLVSIGTSGVVLTTAEPSAVVTDGRLHYFNHARADRYYLMGVTLAAGHSLSWFKHLFAPESSFAELLERVGHVPPGANGLLFTPYITGERTPYADANIRASFIGMDASHNQAHLTRAVLEGITFSLRESIELIRSTGKTVDTIISIGGGSRSEHWLQMQADIFKANVIPLQNEQGPGLGAAMLAAYGSGWYTSLEHCADQFVRRGRIFSPNDTRTELYDQTYEVYRQVYHYTKSLNDQLIRFRR